MIVAAAIKLDGVVYTLPKPKRHHHILEMMVFKYHCETPIHREEQGFIDDRWGFVPRIIAGAIAITEGQTNKLKYQSGELFSEDLW